MKKFVTEATKKERTNGTNCMGMNKNIKTNIWGKRIYGENEIRNTRSITANKHELDEEFDNDCI